jgi:hypothetical protein
MYSAQELVVRRDLLTGRVAILAVEFGDPDAPAEYAFHRRSHSPVK